MLKVFEAAGDTEETEAVRDALEWVLYPEIGDDRLEIYLPEDD